ncbi:MAG TPA: FKBP-type peptidyl-prolyl cis-trans isomerase, partial [Planctomycetota bacterium]|nr:FKBP-type peptidyl-prolyl cis-trans isomerase [Planctomycetota bacterium]
MQIRDGALVTLQFAVFDEGGACLERSEADDPLVFLHGQGELPPGLEEALEGRSAGDRLDVTLEPEDAYGRHDPEGLVAVPREKLPADVVIEEGEWLPILLEPEPGDESDEEEEIEVRVVEVHDDSVVVDLNHPYAGKRLRFEVEVVAVEDTPE